MGGLLKTGIRELIQDEDCLLELLWWLLFCFSPSGTGFGLFVCISSSALVTHWDIWFRDDSLGNIPNNNFEPDLTPQPVCLLRNVLPMGYLSIQHWMEILQVDINCRSGWRGINYHLYFCLSDVSSGEILSLGKLLFAMFGSDVFINKSLLHSNHSLATLTKHIIMILS